MFRSFKNPFQCNFLKKKSMNEWVTDWRSEWLNAQTALLLFAHIYSDLLSEFWIGKILCALSLKIAFCVECVDLLTVIRGQIWKWLWKRRLVPNANRWHWPLTFEVEIASVLPFLYLKLCNLIKKMPCKTIRNSGIFNVPMDALSLICSYRRFLDKIKTEQNIRLLVSFGTVEKLSFDLTLYEHYLIDTFRIGYREPTYFLKTYIKLDQCDGEVVYGSNTITMFLLDKWPSKIITV